jgi:hypothetical protein
MDVKHQGEWSNDTLKAAWDEFGINDSNEPQHIILNSRAKTKSASAPALNHTTTTTVTTYLARRQRALLNPSDTDSHKSPNHSIIVNALQHTDDNTVDNNDTHIDSLYENNAEKSRQPTATVTLEWSESLARLLELKATIGCCVFSFQGPGAMVFSSGILSQHDALQSGFVSHARQLFRQYDRVRYVM